MRLVPSASLDVLAHRYQFVCRGLLSSPLVPDIDNKKVWQGKHRAKDLFYSSLGNGLETNEKPE